MPEEFIRLLLFTLYVLDLDIMVEGAKGEEKAAAHRAYIFC
jgi:hypothetical protein